MGSRPSARRVATSAAVSGSSAATDACRWFLRATTARARSSRRLPSTTSATLSFAGTIVVLSGRASASATTGYVASLARSANRRAVAAAVEAIVRANRARVRTATRGIAARTRLAASAPRESVTFEPASGREERRLQLRRRPRVHDEPERRHLAREQRRVTGRSAVRDDGAVAGERLEAGDAARGVDEHVRGGQQVAHRVGEAEHPHARLVGERAREPSTTSSSRPARQTTVASSSSAVVTAPARSPTPQPPPETTTTFPSIGRPSDAPSLDSRPRNMELASHERRDGRRAAEPGHALDVGHEAFVHHEVQVDALVGPELETGEVGDRRARGHEHLAAQAQ